jgi:hypothetical protein
LNSHTLNQINGVAAHRHRPHRHVDVGFDHQHVEDHIGGREIPLVADVNPELPVQERQQGDDGDRGRKQPEDAIADKPKRIGVGVQRAREHKAADDEEGHDGAGAVGGSGEKFVDEPIDPAIGRARRHHRRNMIADHGQRGDATQGFDARKKSGGCSGSSDV